MVRASDLVVQVLLSFHFETKKEIKALNAKIGRLLFYKRKRIGLISGRPFCGSVRTIRVFPSSYSLRSSSSCTLRPILYRSPLHVDGFNEGVWQTHTPVMNGEERSVPRILLQLEGCCY